MNHLTLDSQLLMDLYGGSRDDARFILNDYVEKYEDIVDAFHEAFHAGIDSLIQCAHRHSSSFSYIGLPQLTSDCKNFELECKNANDTSRVKNSFKKLLITINQSIVLVKQELVRLDKA